MAREAAKTLKTAPRSIHLLPHPYITLWLRCHAVGNITGPKLGLLLAYIDVTTVYAVPLLLNIVQYTRNESF